MKTFPAHFIGAASAALILLLVASGGPSMGQTGQSDVPPFLSATEASKKLPPTLSSATFSDPQVARAYKIAKTIPAVLAQQPCYCWCNRMGHPSLLSCYTSDHASFCDMCLKEAFLAEKMTSNGKNPAQVRAAIIHGDWKVAQ